MKRLHFSNNFYPVASERQLLSLHKEVSRSCRCLSRTFSEGCLSQNVMKGIKFAKQFSIAFFDFGIIGFIFHESFSTVANTGNTGLGQNL
jgi:hypothetical protein